MSFSYKFLMFRFHVVVCNTHVSRFVRFVKFSIFGRVTFDLLMMCLLETFWMKFQSQLTHKREKVLLIWKCSYNLPPQPHLLFGQRPIFNQLLHQEFKTKVIISLTILYHQQLFVYIWLFWFCLQKYLAWIQTKYLFCIIIFSPKSHFIYEQYNSIYN